MEMNVPKPCTECGVLHENPNDHEFIYTDSNDILNKRGLVDSLTLQPFYEPIELNCGHTFSKSSIEEAFRNKKECPICRKKSIKLNSTHTIIRNQLNDLEVKCPNQCDLKLERQFLKTHLLNCPNVKTSCLNKCDDKKCNFIGIKTEMNEHIKVCELRTITCNGEGKCSIVALNLEEHNCFRYLKKNIGLEFQKMYYTSTTEINKLKAEQKLNTDNISKLMNVIGSYQKIIYEQKKTIEQTTNSIKEHKDECNKHHSMILSQNQIIQSQEHKLNSIDKKVSKLVLDTMKNDPNCLFSHSLSSSTPLSLASTPFSSTPLFSSTSTLTNIVGKECKLLFNPEKKICSEGSKYFNTTNKPNFNFGFSQYAPLKMEKQEIKNVGIETSIETSSNTTTQNSLVENETTLPINDRKRKAEDSF